MAILLRTLLPLFAIAPYTPGPDLIQIGTEGGYLISEVHYTNNNPFYPAPISGNMIVAPGERSDFLVDFSGIDDGTEFILYNDAPGPFPDGPPTTDYYWGNTANPAAPSGPGIPPDTRQLLKFRVESKAGVDYTGIGLTGTPILNPTLMDPDPLVAYPTTIVDTN